MKSLIDANLVSVKRENNWLEIEINTDILFRAAPAPSPPRPSRARQAGAGAATFPNPIRVEGHTTTAHPHCRIPSNWSCRRPCRERRAPIHQGRHRSAASRDRRFGEFHPRQPTPPSRDAMRTAASRFWCSTQPRRPPQVLMQACRKSVVSALSPAKRRPAASTRRCS